ncbi:MAG: sigma-70 family RNA polymerase sigma factor [Bacteroidales bacterium]|nr:sigma-70 family RNA polymerase sigma factor [Bacteroidales bacterium]
MLTDLQEIIESVKKGDQAAFRRIVEEYRQQAFSLAFRIMCDEEEARDVVQESFIKVWQKIETYDMTQKFSTWLYKIVANSAIDRLRQIKRHNLVNLEKVISQLDHINREITQMEVDNKETTELIRWLAEGLPEKQQIVFVLRDLQGIESSEVRQILNLSENSVKSNLYHARKAIREKLLKVIK